MIAAIVFLVHEDNIMDTRSAVFETAENTAGGADAQLTGWPVGVRSAPAILIKDFR